MSKASANYSSTQLAGLDHGARAVLELMTQEGTMPGSFIPALLGIDVDPNACNQQGETLLELAAANPKTTLRGLNLLIDGGARVHIEWSLDRRQQLLTNLAGREGIEQWPVLAWAVLELKQHLDLVDSSSRRRRRQAP